MSGELVNHALPPLAYKLVVAGMTLSSINYITERLGICSKPLEPKDMIVMYISPPSVDKVPGCPFTVSFETTQFLFAFRDGRLFMVANTQTNIEAVEHYREWAKMPSLINSNDAYHMATNWLSRVFVDVATLNRKYELHVGQPGFWATPPARWSEQGSNWTTLPLYYVTWSKGDYQAAKVGIFGPTKQFIGLTIQPNDLPPDPSICDHTYLYVTNKNDLLKMTNIPPRLIEANPGLYPLLVPKSPVPPAPTR